MGSTAGEQGKTGEAEDKQSFHFETPIMPGQIDVCGARTDRLGEMNEPMPAIFAPFDRFRKSSAVVTDGFDGAAFLGFLAARLFVRAGRLFIDERVAAVVIPLEIVRGRFAAQVAVNALVVHVVFARHVHGIFVCSVCHKFVRALWPPARGMASAELRLNAEG
jgi:hypothetical protein